MATESAANSLSTLMNSQFFSAPFWHAPATQVSLCVQALPSLHAVPSATGGLEQAPVVGSQIPATWH